MSASFTLRRVLFWTHLFFGLSAGLVIAIMSVTGLALAFEEEITEWCEREAKHVLPPSEDAQRLSLEAILERIENERSEYDPTSVSIPRDRQEAYTFRGHWTLGPLYADPYTGELRGTEAEAMQHFLWGMEAWHRWLAFEKGTESAGRIINGVANLIFLFLCISGLYLWFPRRLRWRAFKPGLWFRKSKGKARDYNWHLVLGFWNLPMLIILVGTAVVISFRWGHNLPFQIFGEEPTESRNYGMMHVPHAAVPTPPEGARKIAYDTAFKRLAEKFPEWTSLYFQLPRGDEHEGEELAHPLEIGVTVPDTMPSRAYIPTEIDPYTGEILQYTLFNDRSPGLKTRVWIRFLHTGEAFGFWYKVLASIATASSLVLVYTGFALSWRRFFRRPKTAK